MSSNDDAADAGKEVLIMNTSSPSLRAAADGWTHEDARLYAFGAPIGMTGSPVPPDCPKNVLHAIARGWKLLAPPASFTWMNADDNEERRTWEWWFTR